MLLYLHGFRSSPRSYKAQWLAAYVRTLSVERHWQCPQLPASPAQAMKTILALAQQDDGAPLTVIGSSLGGYYATCVAERLGCPAVLLNPAVYPVRDLRGQVGMHTQFHTDEPFEFKAAHLNELEALSVPNITRPERYFLIAATGDKVLDWQEMVARYPGARHKILQGSDHGLSDWADWADEVVACCRPALGLPC